MLSLPRWLSAGRHALRFPEVLRCQRGMHNWCLCTLAYLNLNEPNYPLELRMRSGVKISAVDFFDVVTAWVVFCRQEYRVTDEARTIVDLGANYGAFTLYAAARAPHARIVSFEPFPETFSRLEQHVSLNGLQDRVTLVQSALASESGVRRMTLETNSPTQSIGLLAPGTPADETSVEIPTISWRNLIDRVRSELDIDQIDLVKMDIEGSEHDALSGLPGKLFSCVKNLQMEYHPNGPAKRLFETLENGGLRCVADVKHGPNVGIAHFSRR